MPDDVGVYYTIQSYNSYVHITQYSNSIFIEDRYSMIFKS